MKKMLLILTFLSLGGSLATNRHLIEDITTQIHFYKPGVCQNLETKKSRCAVSSDDCIPRSAKFGEKWMNSNAMEIANIPSCTCEKTQVKACFTKIDGGHSKEFRCAPRKDDYCDKGDDSYNFVPSNAANSVCFCDELRSMIDEPAKPTLYGACLDPTDKANFFCAFSPDYCEMGHVWVDPRVVKSLGGEECTCENTRVGGCVGGFQGFHCAISEDGCYSNTFIKPLSLKAEHNHACLLCNKRTRIYKEDEIDHTPNRSQSSGSNKKAVAIALCVTLVVLIALSMAYYLQGRKKKYGKEESNPKNIETNFSDNTNSSPSNVIL